MASLRKKDSTIPNELVTKLAELAEKIALLEKGQALELALEKVRASAMSMQMSGALRQVVRVLYKEVQELGIAQHGVNIMMFDPDNKTIDCWFEEHLEAEHPTIYEIRGRKNYHVRKMWQCWEQQNEGFSIHLKGDKKANYDNYLLEETGWVALPKNVKKDIRSHNEAYFTFSSMKYGLFQIVNLQPIPEDTMDVLDRFAKVFEQSYTRFIDLQKAEAQAREAQIEAALERVRSQTMAIRKSDELSGVVATMFKEYHQLGLTNELTRVTMNIAKDEANKEAEIWLTRLGGQELATRFTYNRSEEPLWKEMWQKWEHTDRDKRKNVKFTFTLEGVALEELKNFGISKNIITPEELIVAEESGVTKTVSHTVWFSYGSINIDRDTQLSEEGLSILQRFAEVFEQTYTRFLDLQKAEAHAREVQIELALERVRARTLAMHQSSELREVALVMYDQMELVGLAKWGCAIVICHQDTKEFEYWLAEETDSDLNENYFASATEHPIYRNIWSHWGNQGPPFTLHHTDAYKRKFDEYWLYKTDFNRLPEEVKRTVLDSREVFLHYATMRYGLLNAVTYEFISDEVLDTLGRFAKVFEQTYTRFLDLKKAEAQAREAQIEAALERVRAASMAMHKTSDLIEVSNVLYAEFRKLGFDQFSQCGFVIVDEKRKEQHFWGASTTDNRLLQFMILPLLGDQVLNDRYQAWKQKEPYYFQVLPPQELQAHLDIAMPDHKITEKEVESKLDMPTISHFYFGNFSHGYLMFISGVEWEVMALETLARFANVFDQTYTRFLDLQKAEAQARDAEIEAALERVRASTMAMHHTSELADATNVLFDQIKALGIDAVSGLISIIDAEQDTMSIYLRHENKLGTPTTVSGDDHANFRAEIDSWKGGDEFIKIRTPKNEFMKSVKKIFGSKVVPRRDKDHFHLLQVHHKYGFLGLGMWDEANQDEYNIYRRFANLFEQTYTRFLDLQKAEAQAREAQIEVALERVRSGSMAMHNSDELREVVAILYQQLYSLGFDSWGCNIVLEDKEHDGFILLMSHNEQNVLTDSYLIPHFDHPIYNQFLKGFRSKKNYFTVELTKEHKKSYDKHVFSKTDLKLLPTEVKKQMRSLKESYAFSANFKYGYLQALGQSLLPDDKAKILQRFASVFNQSYTRFLDLQKAEAQAREAQIEVALERVRATSMAMHKTEELAQVVTQVYNEFEHLDVQLSRCFIVIFEVQNLTSQWWMAHMESDEITRGVEIPFNKLRLFKAYAKGWKERQEEWQLILKGKEKIKTDEYLFTKTGLKNLPPEVKKGMKDPDTVVLSGSFHNYGGIIHGGAAPLNKESQELLCRFSQVFNYSYTRFLEIKKAEARTRQAQIEAGLERVRAKTMAMHQTEDLSSVVGVLYEQVRALNLANEGCNINIFKEDINSIETWMAGFDGISLPECYYMEGVGHPYLKKMWKSWRTQKDLFHISSNSKELKNYVTYILEETDLKRIPDDFKEMMLESPELHFSFISFKYGQIEVVNSTAQLSQENAFILSRFAKVFEQTYTRFLDLARAQAQAREAQVEAALERVRASSMAMHSSSDLFVSAAVLFKQLESLGANLFSCGFALCEENSPISEQWMYAIPVDDFSTHHIKHEKEPFHHNMYKAWKTQEPLFAEWVREKDMENMLEFLVEDPSIKSNIEKLAAAGFDFPKEQKLHAATFSKGYLIIITLEDFEETDIFVRFAKVFEQTYTRFLDLKKAEAQAHEARIEAALEKVRSVSLAMHVSDELQNVIIVVFQQLKLLGIQMDVSYLEIFDDSDQTNMWVANPTFDYAQLVQVPYKKNRPQTRMLEARKSKERFFSDVYGKSDKNKFYRHAFQKSPMVNIPEVMKNAILDRKGYARSVSLTDQMALAVLNLDGEAYSDLDNTVLKRFADVFQQSYTRFLDLQKAEKQKAEIEKVFDENQRLLHSILPAPIAEKIRKGEKTIVRRFDSVSILFADIVGFTVLSDKISPQKVVDILNDLFSRFDDLTDKYKLEKIKTIGDAYMVAAGVPEEKENHAELMFDFAKDMLTSLQDFNQSAGTKLKVRIGISSGPVVAGVIGKKKFAYDLWGDTVNTAARMEANGREDCIQVSPTTYKLLKKDIVFEKRPNVEIKGKGKMDIYLWPC